MRCLLLLLFFGVVNSQYASVRNGFYAFEMPTSTDSAWKIWQDKLRDLDEKLSARYSQQISLLRDRVDHLEKQVDDLIKANTYDWKRTDSGSLYKIFLEKKSFDDAQAVCRHFHSHLAILDSEYKNKYVKDMFNKTVSDDHQDLWVGLKTRAIMGSSSSYSNFARDQPVEGCASMNHQGKWLIKDCDQLKPFICQQVNVR